MFASPALAEDVAAAKALFTEGLEQMQAGLYEKGCPALRESYRLDPRIGTLFTLAECEAKWGRIATAVAHYSNYLNQVAAMPAGQRLKQQAREKVAKQQKDALSPQVPELTLTLPSTAPEGTVVKRNGVIMAAPSLGVALPVDPGEHVIETQAPGGEVTEKKISIERGKQMTVDLEVAEPMTQPEPGATQGAEGQGASKGGLSGGTEPSTPRGQGQRIAGYVVGGVGVAALTVGGIMGGLALSKRGTLSSDFRCFNNPENRCENGAQDTLDQAKAFGWISTVGFGVGLLGLGVGTVLILTAPSSDDARKSSGKAEPTSNSKWMKAGVLSAGPSGALFGVQGGF
ncbi:uncharacterized protein CMC5_006670 [Chondromyces crocatus]|uniref:PEGA domain-containing protein n=1 Tax=Chondromyces crocatus TaxID=52 RepID=A0A0K1E6R3_CHOCO|nr:uncharacterized protein CMC5_006670 [Chondromyces crocatus]